ncbi:MAG: sigma-70 family RNA polymerase sigma factor [Firmicutes bacterium]|nr:sigma-70 family RNA polymerase sigma factor [Bacillota bacterium]
MSNEELAARIQDGEIEPIFTLWERVQKLLYLIAHRYYISYKGRAVRKGLTLEDLEQESYFIFLIALKVYDRTKEYPLNSYFRYAAKNHLNEQLGFRTVKGYRDILSRSVALDTPIADGLTIADTIADNENYFEDVENTFDNRILKQDLNKALNTLDGLQRQVLVQYYYNNCTTAELADICRKSVNSINDIRKRALHKLRRSKYLKEYREKTMRCAWWGGFGFWNSMGSSSTEYTALKLVEGEKKIKEHFHQLFLHWCITQLDQGIKK